MIGLPDRAFVSPGQLSPRALFALRVAQTILVGLTIAVAAASLGLIAGLAPVTTLGGPLLLASMIAAAALVCRTIRHAAAAAAIATATLAAALWLAAHVIDASYDGQEYHFDAVYALRHGWNPFRQDYAAFVPPGAPALLWPQHYPIGAWLLTALAWSTGVSLPAAKGILWLPGLAVAPVWYAVFRGESLARPVSILLAVLAAASPIFIAQMRSHYVDGMLGSLAIAFIGLLALALRHGRKDALGPALCCLVLAVDTKFNAIAIFGAATAAVCLVLLLARQARASIGLGLACLGALLVALLGLGFHPYVTNLVDHGHPFYPVVGAPEYEINSALLPQDVRELPDIVLFLGTTFSSISDGSIRPPFLVDPADLWLHGGPDNVVGGFGPLFAGALVLALAIVALAAWKVPLRRSRAGAVLLVAGFLALSSVVTPYMWWPRFIPQLWTGVFLCAVAAILSERRALRYLGLACAGTLALNSAAVAAGTLRNALLDTATVRAHIAAAQAAPAPFCGAFGAAHARIELMRAAGVRVIPLAQELPLECSGAAPIPLGVDFLERPAQSCPCAAIAHDPTGRWHVPPDRTLEDIRTLRAGD